MEESKKKTKELRSFLKSANYEHKENKKAILKMLLLTGFADEIDTFNAYITNDKTKLQETLLPELKGKNKEEISAYLKDKDVYDVFASIIDNGVSSKNLNSMIVGFTQFKWFARAGERWEGMDAIEKLKQFNDYDVETRQKGVVRQELEKLQLFNKERDETRITEEELEKTKAVAIFGATLTGMEGRIKYLLSTDLKNYELYFLVGQRLINNAEQKTEGLLEKVQELSKENGRRVPQTVGEITETDLGYYLYDKYKEQFKERGIQICTILDTPASLNYENHNANRPNTEATVRDFLVTYVEKENIKAKEKREKLSSNILDNIIYISNGINVNPQRNATQNVYQEFKDNQKYSKSQESAIQNTRQDLTDNQKRNQAQTEALQRVYKKFRDNGGTDIIIPDSKKVAVKGSVVPETTQFSQISGTIAGSLYSAYDRQYENSSMKIDEEKKTFKNEKLAYNNMKEEIHNLQHIVENQTIQGSAIKSLSPIKRAEPDSQTIISAKKAEKDNGLGK